MGRAPPVEEASAEAPLRTNSASLKLLAGCYDVKLCDISAPLVARAMHSIAAMQVAAQNCDYYITKYQTKALEQMSNVVVQYALGIRRLEAEERGDSAVATSAADRARRVCIRMAMAADRSTWISSVSLTVFIMCGEYYWTSHQANPLFTSRPLYFLHACKRLQQRAADPSYLVEAAETSLLDAFQVQLLSPRRQNLRSCHS